MELLIQTVKAYMSHCKYTPVYLCPAVQLNRYAYREVNDMLNAWSFLDTCAPAILKESSFTMPELLYSKFYWFTTYKETLEKHTAPNRALSHDQNRIFEEIVAGEKDAVELQLLQAIDQHKPWLSAALSRALEPESKISLIIRDIDELMEQCGYESVKLYETQGRLGMRLYAMPTAFYNRYRFLDTCAADILRLSGHTRADILYSKYYWCFGYAYSAAGLQNAPALPKDTASAIIGELTDVCGRDVDWTLLRAVQEGRPWLSTTLSRSLDYGVPDGWYRLPGGGGAPATDGQIDALEQQIGFPFPESYRHFLKGTNGGSFALYDTRPVRLREIDRLVSPSMLYGVAPGNGTTDLLYQNKICLRTDYVIIGRCFEEGYLAFRRSEPDGVYYWDQSRRFSPAGEAYLIAGDFPGFFDWLFY